MLDFKRLKEHWQSHGIECASGASLADIATFETSNGVVLPNDMRSYFLTVNGMGELGTSDNDFFSFWAIQDLKTVAEDLPNRTARFADAARYYMFADHSIGLPTYAIRLSENPQDETPVASVFADRGSFGIETFFGSFTEFVNGYLNDPAEISGKIPETG